MASQARLCFPSWLGLGSSLTRKVSGLVWWELLQFPSRLTGFSNGIKVGRSYGSSYHPVSLSFLWSRWDNWPQSEVLCLPLWASCRVRSYCFPQRSAHLLAKGWHWAACVLDPAGKVMDAVVLSSSQRCREPGWGVLARLSQGTWIWVRGSTSQSFVCL